MTTESPALKYHLRPFEARDIAPWTAILNKIYPDEPSTIEQNEHWESTYPTDNPRFRRVAETAEGQLIGYGECQRPYWSSLKTDTCMVFVAVDPAWQHCGIGQALYAAVTPFAETLRAVRLRTDCREDSEDTIRFLGKTGFARIGIRFESSLDMEAFDETPFRAVVERFEAAGYTLTTLAEARRKDSEADQHLYEVFASTIVEVPFPGEERIEPTYENFRINTLDAPNTDPNAIFIARLGDHMVGMTSLELLPNGIGITGMTGVLRQHRGRGVALAIKLAAFRYLKEHGYRETRAHNDTANPPILALNAKLGYRRLPGWLVWEKLC